MSDWKNIPYRWRLGLLWEFHRSTPTVFLASVLTGCDPYQFMLDRQRQRFIQMGGVDMGDKAWERYLNEMPISDFITVMLQGDGADDEEIPKGISLYPPSDVLLEDDI